VPGGARVIRANSESETPRKKVDCRFGERQWEERFRN